MEMMVYKGCCWFVVNVYFKLVFKWVNLDLIIGVFVCKVIIENGWVIGVEFEIGGEICFVNVVCEVVFLVLVINLLKILMQLGIGLVFYLLDFGIDVVVDWFGIGVNLQDYLEFYIQQVCIQLIIFYKYWNFFFKVLIGV